MPNSTVADGGSAVLEDPARACRLGSVSRLAVGNRSGGAWPGACSRDSARDVLQPAQGPPVLTKLPQPRQPSVADLRPAVTAAAFAAKTASAAGRASHAYAQSAKATAAGGASHGNSASAHGKIKTTPSVSKARGNSRRFCGGTMCRRRFSRSVARRRATRVSCAWLFATGTRSGITPTPMSRSRTVLRGRRQLQLDLTEATIAGITGHYTRLVRPPYSATPDSVTVRDDRDLAALAGRRYLDRSRRLRLERLDAVRRGEDRP